MVKQFSTVLLSQRSWNGAALLFSLADMRIWEHASILGECVPRNLEQHIQVKLSVHFKPHLHFIRRQWEALTAKCCLTVRLYHEEG